MSAATQTFFETNPPTAVSRSFISFDQATLSIDPATYRVDYNASPFSFTHNLHHLDLFQPASLEAIVERYTVRTNYHVTGSASSPANQFFDSPTIDLDPKHALEQMEQRPTRILLKRLEQHDDGFRLLRDRLIEQLRALPGGLGRRPINRIQSSLFISSAAATTPVHFDPEVNFFFQIEGEKTCHVYPPDDVGEEELEAFYARGRISIGQVALSQRNPVKEHVYNLLPGLAVHQPQNAPHWVQTCGSRSVSYSLVFETDQDQALGRTRAFNNYERGLGAKPVPPGRNPKLDSIKAATMKPNIFVRKVISRLQG